MKTTIDFDDALYRRLEIEAARRGRTVRDLVADGVRRVLDTPDAQLAESGVAAGTEVLPARPLPSWVGALRDYARNANGVHDLASIRANIAAKRAAEWAERHDS